MFGSWLKTSMLMAGIVALFGAIGYLLGGGSGMLIALVLGGAMNIWAYWNSDKLVLRMYNARQVDETTAPELFSMVRDLAQRAGLPMPKVFVIDEDQPNAFATGRNPQNAAVAATTGIMRMLSPRELRGVMAHELSHVKHRDIADQYDIRITGRCNLIGCAYRNDVRRPQSGRRAGRRESSGRAVGDALGAVSGDGDPVRHFSLAGIRSGSRRRGDFGRPASARGGARQDRPICARTADARRGATSGNRADDDHQSSVGRRVARFVQHPSLHAGAHRALARNGDVKCAVFHLSEQLDRDTASGSRIPKRDYRWPQSCRNSGGAVLGQARQLGAGGRARRFVRIAAPSGRTA